MELKCAGKRRSENMKRNTEFQRHLELLMVLPRQKILSLNCFSQNLKVKSRISHKREILNIKWRWNSKQKTNYWIIAIYQILRTIGPTF